jgi:hypothetical protein
MHKAWLALVLAGVLFGGAVGPLLGILANSTGSSLGIWLAAGISVVGDSLLVTGVLLKPKGG